MLVGLLILMELIHFQSVSRQESMRDTENAGGEQELRWRKVERKLT